MFDVKWKRKSNDRRDINAFIKRSIFYAIRANVCRTKWTICRRSMCAWKNKWHLICFQIFVPFQISHFIFIHNRIKWINDVLISYETENEIYSIINIVCHECWFAAICFIQRFNESVHIDHKSQIYSGCWAHLCWCFRNFGNVLRFPSHLLHAKRWNMQSVT